MRIVGRSYKRRPRSDEISGATKDRAYSPANLSNGGAYDIVCCAVVGLMFPGLEARSHVGQRRGDASNKKLPTFFIVFLRRLIYDCTVF